MNIDYDDGVSEGAYAAALATGAGQRLLARRSVTARAARRAGRLAVVLLAGLAVVGCGNARPAADVLRIEIGRASTPVTPGGTAVVTLSYSSVGRNAQARGLRFRSDKHLRARYIGHSTCRRGCVGAGLWDVEGRRVVNRGLDGRTPIPIDQKGGHKLVLALHVTRSGASDLRQRCLRLRAIEFVMTDGTTVQAEQTPDGFFAGVQQAEPRSPSYQTCFDEP